MRGGESSEWKKEQPMTGRCFLGSVMSSVAGSHDGPTTWLFRTYETGNRGEREYSLAWLCLASSWLPILLELLKHGASFASVFSLLYAQADAQTITAVLCRLCRLTNETIPFTSLPLSLQTHYHYRLLFCPLHKPCGARLGQPRPGKTQERAVQPRLFSLCSLLGPLLPPRHCPRPGAPSLSRGHQSELTILKIWESPCASTKYVVTYLE